MAGGSWASPAGAHNATQGSYRSWDSKAAAATADAVDEDAPSSPSQLAAREGAQAAPVALNVYWLRRVQLDGQGRLQKSMLGATGGLSWARMLADTALGAYHVGIEVHGMELSFGTARAPNAQRLGGEASGVFRHTPRQPGPRYAFREAVPLGTTDLGAEEVEQSAALLGITDFGRTSYCSLNHNCTDFAEALAARLGADLPPVWCRRGALLARALGLSRGCSGPAAQGSQGPGLCHTGGANCNSWTLWNCLCSELAETDQDSDRDHSGSMRGVDEGEEEDVQDDWDSLPDLSEGALVTDWVVPRQPSHTPTPTQPRSLSEPFISSSGLRCDGNLQAAFRPPVHLKTVQLSALHPRYPSRPWSQKVTEVEQAQPNGSSGADGGGALAGQLKEVPCPLRIASSPAVHAPGTQGAQSPLATATAAAAVVQPTAPLNGGV